MAGHTCERSRQKPWKRSGAGTILQPVHKFLLAGLMMLDFSAAAAAEILVIRLPSAPRADVEGYIKTANKIWERLGVSVRAAPAAGKASEFDFAALPFAASVAVVGSPADIKTFLKKKSPADAAYLEGWTGGDEVERSQNTYAWLNKHRGGGRVIAVDASAVAWYSGIAGFTKEQAGGFILVHGSGHNSDLDGQLQHNEMGIMVDARVMQWDMSKADKDFYKITLAMKNPKLIAHLKTRYAK